MEKWSGKLNFKICFKRILEFISIWTSDFSFNTFFRSTITEFSKCPQPLYPYAVHSCFSPIFSLVDNILKLDNLISKTVNTWTRVISLYHGNFKISTKKNQLIQSNCYFACVHSANVLNNGKTRQKVSKKERKNTKNEEKPLNWCIEMGMLTVNNAHNTHTHT